MVKIRFSFGFSAEFFHHFLFHNSGIYSFLFTYLFWRHFANLVSLVILKKIKQKNINYYQGLSLELETEGITYYLEWALRVPVSIKNLKICGCHRWCSEFRRVPGTRGNWSPVQEFNCDLKNTLDPLCKVFDRGTTSRSLKRHDLEPPSNKIIKKYVPKYMYR